MGKIARKILIVIGTIILILIGSCNQFFGKITLVETRTSTPTYQSIVTNTLTPTNTVEVLPTKTISPSITTTTFNLPNWVVDKDKELYLCISADATGERMLSIANPLSQEIFLLPIKEREIKGYFWIADSKLKIGWVNRRLDEYSLLDVTTGKIHVFPLSVNSKMFLVNSFTGTNSLTPLEISSHAIPLIVIESGDNEVYFVRQDVNYLGTDYSNNLSPDKRFYIFDIWRNENNLTNTIQVKGFDFFNQSDIAYEIPGNSTTQPVVHWLPNSSNLVDIGDFIIDILSGSIIQELPDSGSRTWHSDGDELFYNPIDWSTFSYSENIIGHEIYVYNRIKNTVVKLDSITEYFQHSDTFTLQDEMIDNISYIPSINVLGFSYFGFGSFEQNGFSAGGGYCLFSLATHGVNCITDSIDEMLITVDEAAQYYDREHVIFAQWSNSSRFIAFLVQRADDSPRVLIYDILSESYFFIENNYEYGPLGVWSP